MRTARRVGKDAAYPGDLGGDIACGYAGGALATHAWTGAEWAAQSARWRLPIWVPDPAGNAAAQAADCLAALKALGVPKGVAYSLDMETSGAAGFVHEFAAATEAEYLCVPYGSSGNVFSLPVRAGYWVADPTGQPHFYPHPGVVGTQWLFAGAYDESWFTVTLPLWDTRPAKPAAGTEYVAVRLPDGAAAKMLSGMTLK
jgi:hypothetical protein